MSLSGDHSLQAIQLEEQAREQITHELYGIAAVTVARAQVHATLAVAAAMQEQTVLAHGVTP